VEQNIGFAVEVVIARVDIEEALLVTWTINRLTGHLAFRRDVESYETDFR
jgi:hypothetical protein